MLTWFCGPQSRDCTGLSRRDFVRIGALSLGSLALPQLLAAKEAAKQQNYFRHKSVVLLFLGGGPSHIETFNPNTGTATETSPFSSARNWEI